MTQSYLGQLLERLPREFSNFKEKDIRWLGRYLPRYYNYYIESTMNLSDQINQIADFFNNNPDSKIIVNDLVIKHREMVVDVSYFSWISNDERAITWIYLELYNYSLSNLNFIQIPPISTIIKENRLIEIYLALDMSLWTNQNKLLTLHNLKSSWSYVKTPDNDIKWIKAKDINQLKWAWSYLTNHLSNALIPNPVSDIDYYNAVILAFDRFAPTDFAMKKLFIMQMRKTWSQKKYRDSGRAKKPYSFPLTKSTRDQLDALAKHYSIEPYNVLEQLINQDYLRVSQPTQIPSQQVSY